MINPLQDTAGMPAHVIAADLPVVIKRYLVLKGCQASKPAGMHKSDCARAALQVQQHVEAGACIA